MLPCSPQVTDLIFLQLERCKQWLGRILRVSRASPLMDSPSCQNNSGEMWIGGVPKRGVQLSSMEVRVKIPTKHPAGL